MDVLSNAPLKEVANATFIVIDRLQIARPEVQQAALAAAFLLLSSHRNVDPSDIYQMARNMLMAKPKDPSEDHFKAVRDYIANEIPR